MSTQPIPTFASVAEFVDLLQTRPLNYHNSYCTEPPAVSIISPFYNDSEHFPQAYQSVIQQTWQNFEWFIVDDCSTEAKSVELLATLKDLNPKIKPLKHMENQGPSVARNTAIAKARGKYLFFMDTDDLIEPTYIEKCVLFLETHPEFSLVNSYSVGFGDEEYWWTFGFNQPSKFIEQNWVTGRLLYRRDDFLQLGGYNPQLRVYEDWERWLKAIVNQQQAWTIPEFLDLYRRTDSGLLASGRSDSEQNQRIIEQIQAQYQPFFSNNPPPDVSLRRSSFNPHHLRQKIALENQLNQNNQGKRILCWFPHLVVGGADKFNLDLITALKEKGYDLTIATTLNSEHTWHEQFYRQTADIFHLPLLANDCHWLTIARHLIASRNIDLVLISNSYYAYYLLPFLRLEFPQVAFIDYTHTDDPGWRGGGYPRVSCQFSEFLDLQIVSSQNLATYYQQLKPNLESQLRVCYTNEDPEKWQPNVTLREQVRAKLGIHPEQVLLFFPARLAPQKRPHFLVQIVSQLALSSPNIAVVMLGNGELKPKIVEQIETSPAKSLFYLLDSVAPAEMIGYYSAADIFLLPSAYEGISLALYEAMSMALPVVASDVGGQQELVSKDCGYLIPKGKGDDQELQQYLAVLQPLVINPQLRRQLGTAARERIKQHFSLQLMVEKMETLFQEALTLRKQNQNTTVNLAIAEEMLIWLQENLALDYLWQDLKYQAQELVALQNFNQHLQQENNALQSQNQAWRQIATNDLQQLNQENERLKTQNQAWIRVAQQAELELAELQQKLAQLEVETSHSSSSLG